jgi:hypothetical protein
MMRNDQVKKATMGRACSINGILVGKPEVTTWKCKTWADGQH